MPKKKIKKRITWKSFRMKCIHNSLCDCGDNFLCFHPNTETDICDEKEDCPAWKDRHK